jgi:hypothetical protein
MGSGSVADGVMFVCGWVDNRSKRKGLEGVKKKRRRQPSAQALSLLAG